MISPPPKRKYQRKQPAERLDLRAPFLAMGWHPCASCGLGVAPERVLCPWCERGA